LALEPNTLALQARTLIGNQNSFPQTSKTWALATAAQQQPQQPGEGSPVVPQHQPGGLAAAQHQPGEGNLAAAKAIAANQNMVPQTNPNSVPQTNQNSVPQTSEQKSTKNFQKRSKFSRQKFGKFRQNFNVQKRY
jgi:hypothetical protein